MTNQERTIELLSKNNLTAEENSFLTEELKNNKELAKYKVIHNLLNDMQNTFHLSSDLISEYVLYKNGLEIEDKSIVKFIPKIKEHISKCEKCKSEFELFNQEYSEVDNYLSKHISKTNFVDGTLNKTDNNTKIFSLFSKKYFYAAAAAVVFFTFSLFDLSQFSVPSYKNLSNISELSNFSNTRGRVSTDFYNGIKALNNNDFGKAIEMLKTDIKNNPKDETIFYTDYMLGLIYLKKSESNFLGLFKSFDQSDIDSSIANFERSINNNKSESFSNIAYNSYFYIGKAFLLTDDFENALDNLQIVVDKKGGYTKNAKELIEIIKSE